MSPGCAQSVRRTSSKVGSSDFVYPMIGHAQTATAHMNALIMEPIFFSAIFATALSTVASGPMVQRLRPFCARRCFMVMARLLILVGTSVRTAMRYHSRRDVHGIASSAINVSTFGQ
jgi:hypothetical protein